MCLGRYAVRVNGLDCLAITKLDVLDQFDQIKVCVAYRDPTNGKTYKELPSIGSPFQHMEPVYESLPGWGSQHGNVERQNICPTRQKIILNFFLDS